MTKLYLLFQLLLLSFALMATPPSEDSKPKIKSIGIPFMTSYSYADYEFGSQNFDVLVGDDDRIYFANTDGILVYDGTNWIKLPLPNKYIPYSLTKSNNGTIYVGAVNEVGYLSTTTKGELIYISLKDKLSESANKIFTTWNNFTIGNEIVFSTTDQLFIFNEASQEIKVIDSPSAIWSMRVVNNNMYSYQGDTLYQLVDYKWKPLRYSNLYEGERGRKVLLVGNGNGKTLAVTKNGFFNFETDAKIKINEAVEKFLNGANPYSVQLLMGQYLIICTLKGLLITDLEGNPIQFIDKKRGLSSDLALHAALDKSGVLWVSTFDGLDKIEIFSPFTIFDQRSGVENTVNNMEFFDDRVYLITSSGIYAQSLERLVNPFETISFDKLREEIGWMSFKTENELFILGENKTWYLKDDKLTEVIYENAATEIYWSGFKYKSSDDVLLGSSDGKIMHLVKKDKNWVVKTKVQTQFPDLRYLSEGSGNEVWMSDRSNGIYKINYNKKTSIIINEKKYGKAEGLPNKSENYVYSIADSLTFITGKGIYIYDKNTDLFSSSEAHAQSVASDSILGIYDDSKGNVYYYAEGLYGLENSKGDFSKIDISKGKLKDKLMFDILPIDAQNLLLGTFHSFIHIDPSYQVEPTLFDVNFSSVESLNNSDTVFFSGFGTLPENIMVTQSDNALRFGFSAAFYENQKATKYRWRLKGLDSDWSPWSSESTKDYTNLPHGKYKFEIIAKNVYGIESSPATIHFTIETPWYFTIWAYIFYGIGFLLFMWAVVKLNTRRLLLEKKKLEQIVDDRTKQISLQKEKAEKDAETISGQNEKLVEMDELKGRFFLNISHELRTPLTLTMGTVEQAIKGKYGSLNDELYANLKSSFRNSQRLLKMVNNILDISKLEGGKMQLHASKTKPAEILSKVLDFFSSKFFGKDIELKSDVSNDVELYIDKDKFESIFINLIANAFRFTNEGGLILVTSSDDQEQITFTIKDDGIGIPEADLGYVFDRFYQSSHGPSDGGTGLGLALTKELVELHHGTISVKSDLNSGSEFTVTFLKGSEHLLPDQIFEKKENAGFKILEDKYPLTDDLRLKSELLAVKKALPTDQEKPHILLVEDNSEMSKFVSELLFDNYYVSIAENGQEALEFLKKHIPDLILTDYLMPIMDGYEMATEIKKSDSLNFIPMIFLTARTEEQDKINVLNLGVDDYLFKPFSNDELQVRIKNLLNTKKQRVEYLAEKSIDPRDIEWKEFPSKLKLNIDDYIKAHIKDEITGEDLSTFTTQSERSLYRKVKVNTGLSLMQYIKEFRLRKARTLLEQKEVQTVSEAAYAVGFNYLSHFTKNYKERFGKQPSEYLD